MAGRRTARLLHRITASRRNDEAIMAWDGRDADLLPDRPTLADIIKRRAELQTRFADLATAVATFGADAASVAKLEEIRAELAVVERDLAMSQGDSAS